MHSHGTCGNCQRKPPPFRRCISAFHYQPPIDRLVKRLKRDINSPELIQLSGFLADLISASYGTNIPLLVIPLPLHWTRLVRRGFNQSHSIAAQLQQRLSHLEVRADICQRTQRASPQRQHNKQQRLHNIVDAFEVTDPNAIAGRALALVDDVMTTGATARAAANRLIKAGAKSVAIWCIARKGWYINAGSLRIV